MTSKPFVSIRKSIKWGDAPAFENTDTLVLTTASKHFVDIRIYLPTTPSSPSLPTTAPLPATWLEWGFAGTSSSTPATYKLGTKELVKPSHTVWTHWVDNKTTEVARDEGDMYPVEGSNEVLEKGAMVNPRSGVVESYEEVWEDLELEAKGTSWVLRTEGDVVRGMIARIGGFVSGVLRRGDVVSVGRWKDGEVVVRIGELEIPSHTGEMQVGQKFEAGGLVWECVESFNWG